MPLRGVPAGQEDTGGIDLGLLGEGRKELPRERGFGAGERGLEKGCAAAVEVAAVRPSVRGGLGVAMAGSNRREEDVNVRVEERRADARCKQRLQIMVAVK